MLMVHMDLQAWDDLLADVLEGLAMGSCGPSSGLLFGFCAAVFFVLLCFCAKMYFCKATHTFYFVKCSACKM